MKIAKIIIQKKEIKKKPLKKSGFFKNIL